MIHEKMMNGIRRVMPWKRRDCCAPIMRVRPGQVAFLAANVKYGSEEDMWVVYQCIETAKNKKIKQNKKNQNPSARV